LTSKMVLDLARVNLDALIPYAITSVELENLEMLINRFKSTLPVSRLSVSEQKTNNGKLKAMMRNSKSVLIDQIKRMMVRYKTINPEFYAGYLNASKVVSYGIRHDKTETPDTTA